MFMSTLTILVRSYGMLDIIIKNFAFTSIMNQIKLLTCASIHDRKPLYLFLTMHDISADIPASFSYKEIKVSFKCSKNDLTF